MFLVSLSPLWLGKHFCAEYLGGDQGKRQISEMYSVLWPSRFWEGRIGNAFLVQLCCAWLRAFAVTETAGGAFWLAGEFLSLSSLEHESIGEAGRRGGGTAVSSLAGGVCESLGRKHVPGIDYWLKSDVHREAWSVQGFIQLVLTVLWVE